MFNRCCRLCCCCCCCCCWRCCCCCCCCFNLSSRRSDRWWTVTHTRYSQPKTPYYKLTLFLLSLLLSVPILCVRLRPKLFTENESHSTFSVTFLVTFLAATKIWFFCNCVDSTLMQLKIFQESAERRFLGEKYFKFDACLSAGKRTVDSGKRHCFSWYGFTITSTTLLMGEL